MRSIWLVLLIAWRLFYLLLYHCLVSKPEEVMKIEPTTHAPNFNAVNAMQDIPGFLRTIAKLLVVNMGLQRLPTTKEINVDNSQGITVKLRKP